MLAKAASRMRWPSFDSTESSNPAAACGAELPCSNPSRIPFIEVVNCDCLTHAFPRTNNDRTGNTTSKFGKFGLRLVNEGESGIADFPIHFPSQSKSTDHLMVSGVATLATMRVAIRCS